MLVGLFVGVSLDGGVGCVGGVGVAVGVGDGVLFVDLSVDFLTTVTLQVALAFLFFLDMAVIFAVPTFFALTTPRLLTVATDLLLDFHVTFLDALAGFTFFTFNVNLLPTVNFFFLAESVIFFVFGAAFTSGMAEKAVAQRAIDKATAQVFFNNLFILILA